MYLDAQGGAGADGAVPGVSVQVPGPLRGYQLQWPGGSNRIVEAVRASLACLAMAPDRVSIPLLSAVYRAPFGKTPFSVFLAGQSGVFKTTMAAICQQHFGKDMGAGNLPANFASTGNALEALAFQAKDTLLVVDDYAPGYKSGDGELYHLAERLFRAAGNGQGRTRLRGGGQVESVQPPRALLLATGEKVPPGRSIRARLIVVAVELGDADRAALSECQRAGQDGLLAESMSAFIAWIAANYEERQGRLQAKVLAMRVHGDRKLAHARLPAALADLQAGWEMFLEFAFEVGAINSVERDQLEKRAGIAFPLLALLQAQYHEAGDPAARFLRLLEAALACGQGHVADRQGKAPREAAQWGWHRKGVGWIPSGTRFGWISGQDLFLDPTISYQLAQQQAGPERLLFGQQAMRQRLRQAGLLASVDRGRGMVQVRRTLEGSPKQVLHLKARDLLSGPEGC